MYYRAAVIVATAGRMITSGVTEFFKQKKKKISPAFFFFFCISFLSVDDFLIYKTRRRRSRHGTEALTLLELTSKWRPNRVP